MPVVASERSARETQLHDVEEPAPACIQLDRAVVKQVVSATDAGGDLLTPAEIDIGKPRGVKRRVVFMIDRKSTRLNSSHEWTSYAVFCLKKKEKRSIQAPVLIASGAHDPYPVQHSLEASQRIPNAKLASIRNEGHFVLYSEPETVLPILQ